MAISATDGSGFYIFPKGGDLLPMPGSGDSNEEFTNSATNANTTRFKVIRS
jgi:hypothetical protein